MVKNLGGNKAKGFARKHTNAGKSTNKLRVIEFDGELYAVATKMLGNCMFHAYGMDNNKYLVQIRGKFTGRYKRDSFINTGSWVLIGAREFCANTDVKKAKNDEFIKADLLEVYNDDDKRRLENTVAADWHILNNNDPTKQILKNVNDDYADDGFKFASAQDVEDQELLELMKIKKLETVTLNSNSNSNSNEDQGTSYDWIDASDI